eukprot:s3436_g3.t1
MTGNGGNGIVGDMKHDADENTPGTPQTSFSRALSEVVQDKMKELEDYEFDAELELCQRTAAETELGAVVNVSNCSAEHYGFNVLEAFEHLTEHMENQRSDSELKVRKNRRRLKVKTLRSTCCSGTTMVSDIDRGFVSASVRDLLMDTSLVKDIGNLCGCTQPTGDGIDQAESVDVDAATSCESRGGLADAAGTGLKQASNLSQEEKELIYHVDTLFGDLEKPTFSRTDDDSHPKPAAKGWQCLTQPPSRIVKTVEQGLEFQKDALQFLLTDDECDDPDVVINQLTEALESDSLSTCYSGVESAHTATNCTAYALSELTGNPMVRVPLQYMIEWDPENQKELLLVAESHPECCLFGDVASFFREEIHETIHQHQAGTSCRPFSRRGAHLGLMDIETVHLLAWIGLRLSLQEADVTAENVETQALLSIISRFLLGLYHIDQYVGCPTEFGWPVARSRQFLRLRHRVKVLEQLSPITRFAKRFWRAVEFEWAAMMCFHLPQFQDKTVVEEEIQKELDWGQGRQNSRSYGQDRVLFGVHEEPFLAVLTDTEYMHWQAYKSRWPGTAGQLNQDSMSPHATHSTQKCLHTLIANCGIIMSDQVSPERWLLGSECLLAQGFPILPGCFGDAKLLD